MRQRSIESSVRQQLLAGGAAIAIVLAGGPTGWLDARSGAAFAQTTGGMGGAAGQAGAAGTGPNAGSGGATGGASSTINSTTTLNQTVFGGHGGSGSGASSGLGGATSGGGGGAGGNPGLIITNGAGLTNQGTITGGRGGDGGDGFSNQPANRGGGGTGGTGVSVTGTSTLTNSGTISGGRGGAGGTVGSGSGGVGALFSVGGTVVNIGTITGGDSGGVGGTGGAGVSGANLTIQNFGMIQGGLNANGTRASAVQFTGGVNELQLIRNAGAAVNPSIPGGVSTTNGAAYTLVLGGTATDSTFDVTQLGTVFNNVVSLRKQDSGMWELQNTTTAPTQWTVTGGLLAARTAGALGTGGLILRDGGGLRALDSFTYTPGVALANGQGVVDVVSDRFLTLSGLVSGPGTLVKTNTGTLRLTGANTYSGGTVITGGAVEISATGALGTGGVTLDGGTLRALQSLALESTRALRVGAAGGTLDNGRNTLTVASLISDSVTPAGRLVFFGGGTTVVQQTANTYSGGSLINGGTTVQIAGGQSLGTGSIRLDNGTLATGGTPITLANALELLADGGTITTAAGHTLTATGAITGAGSLVKTGAGTLILTNANSAYGGVTRIENGVLQIGASGSLGRGGLIIQNGSTLRTTDTLTYGPRVTLNGGGGTIEVTTGVTTLSGLVEGTGALTKSGAGTLALMNAGNTYSGGTNVLAGVLAANGTGTLGSGAVTLDGGTLRALQALDLGTRAVRIGAGNGTIDTNGADLTGKLVTIGGLVSGPGRLTLTGGGEVRLVNGTNTYAGGTLVTNGTTLTISGNDSAGTGTIALDNATLRADAVALVVDNPMIFTNAGTIDTQGNLLHLGGPLSGIGSLRKIGSGTLELTGTNTYAGGTDLVVGTLAVGNNAALGAGTLRMQGGTLASLVDGITLSNAVSLLAPTNTVSTAAGHTLTLSGVISGAGALRKTGPGTLALSGANTYAGGTLLQQGTLRIAHNQALGTGTLTLSGGTLATGAPNLTVGNAVTLSGGTTSTISTGTGHELTLTNTLTGSGSLVKAGAGTLILSNGGSSYGGTTRIEGGVLQISSANALGQGGLEIVNNATLRTTASLTYGRNVSIGGGGGTVDVAAGTKTIFSGGVTGAGLLTKAGAGELEINTLATTVQTTVTGGLLRVNSSVGSTVVQQNATLSGVGSLGDTVVFGVLSPGNSLGTQTFTNLTLTSASVTRVELAATLSDLIKVTGTATLAGTLQLVGVDGGPTLGRRYTILEAGTIAGRFGNNVSGVFGPVIVGRVLYVNDVNASADQANPTKVVIAVDQVTVVAGLQTSGTATTNQVAVGRVLDQAAAQGGNIGPFLGLLTGDGSTLGQRLNQLTGEASLLAGGMGAQAGSQFLGAMMAPLSGGGRDGLTTFTPDTQRTREARAAARTVGVASTNFEERRFGIWGSVLGATTRTEGAASVGSSTSEVNTSSFVAGADVVAARGVVLGVAAGGGTSSGSLANGLGSASGDFAQVGLYGRMEVNAVRLSAAGAFTFMDVETSRIVPALGATRLTGRTDAKIWSGRVEAAYALGTFNGLGVAPLFALQSQSVQTNGYTETSTGSSAAALNVAGRTLSTTRTELGIGLTYATPTPSGAVVTANGKIAWVHYLQRDATMTASFVGLPGSFQATGARPDRDGVLLSGGLDIQVNPAWSFGARLDGEFSDNMRQVTGAARVRYSF